MKLLLYPHGGSGNHGCEAIVRSTLKMIPTATLFSSNPDEDKRYGLDAICTLRAAQAPMSHLSLAYWKAFIRYRFVYRWGQLLLRSACFHLFGQQTASKTRDKDYLVGMFR